MRQSHSILNSLLSTDSSRIKFSCFLFLFVFVTTFPKYIEILNDSSPATTYAYFFEKIKHPLSPSGLNDIQTHGSKIAFRLTPPLIGKISGVHLLGNGKGIVVLYIIQSLLLLPFFYFLIQTVRKFANNATTFLIAISFSAIYVTKAFFWDYDFWFDGYAYFFLMLSISSKNKALVLLSSQLACWTDERAVVALYSVYIYHLLEENDFNAFSWHTLVKLNFKAVSTVILLSGLIYAAMRTIFSLYFKLNTPIGDEAGVGFDIISFQLNNRLIGVFLSFEGLWIIFIIAIIFLITKRKFFLTIVLFSIVGIHILIAYSVYDITRSLSYAFPLFIICFSLIAKKASHSTFSSIQLSTLICILVPTQFLIFFTRQIPWTIFSYPEIKIVLKGLVLSL